MDRRLKLADPPPWWRRWEPRFGTSVKARVRPLGLRRLAYDLGILSSLRASNEEFVAASMLDVEVTHELGANARWGGASELAGLAPSLRATPLADLGDIPLTVVTGGPSTHADRQRWYPEWKKLQAELVNSSTRGRQVVAAHAGHDVHRDDPDLVIGVILAARGGVTRD